MKKTILVLLCAFVLMAAGCSKQPYVVDNCFISQHHPSLVIKVDPRMSFVGDKSMNGIDVHIFRSKFRKLQIIDTSRGQELVAGLNLGLNPFSIHAGGGLEVQCGIDSYSAKNIMGVNCLVSEDSKQEYGIEYFEVVNPSVFSGDINSLLDQTKSHFRNSVEFIAYNSPSNESTSGHKEYEARDIPKWSHMVRDELDNKKYDEAIRHAELFINTQPDCVSAYVLKSRGLYLKGDFDQALAEIDKAGEKVLNWESWEGRGAENSRTPQDALKAYEAFKVIVMRIDEQKQAIQKALDEKKLGQAN